MAKVHYGKSVEGKVPLLPLHDYIWSKTAQYGDRVCMTNVTNDEHCTFAALHDKCEQLASGLKGLGLVKGDIITCYAYSSIQYITVVLGGLSAGLTVNTLNPAATPYELRHYLTEVNPKLIYTESSLLANVNASIKVLRQQPKLLVRSKENGYLCLGEVYSRVSDVIKTRRGSFDVKQDVAIILFSSGTTGLPKGVMLTHYNIVSNLFIREIVDYIPPEMETGVCVFPMYHAGGLFGGFLFSAIGGRHLVFMEKYDLQLLLRSIHKYKPESMYLPPPVIVQLAKTPLLEEYDVSSVKICRTSAAPVKHETEESFKKRFNYPATANGYGMSEAVGGVIYKAPLYTEDQKHPGTSGKPVLGTSLKVVDPDTGELMGPHKRGELCIHSPQIMKGYLNNVKATLATVDQDGWLHSGDVAYYDDDGYFYIVDRIKELIKYKGNQVAPAELEALLLEHDDVIDVGVVGVGDTEAGELPRAYIVRRESSTLTEQQVMDYVNDRVSYYKRLRGGVRFLDEIPKLPSGKILRRTLRDMANNNSKL